MSNPHIHVTPLGDIDAFFDEMHANEQAANERVTDAQREIGWGDHFVRVYGTSPDHPPIVIFGKIVTHDWVAENEPEAYTHMLASYDRGYRFAWCYSTIEPTGEPGDTHISVMDAITPAEFAAAESVGWDPAAWAKTPDGRLAIERLIEV